MKLRQSSRILGALVASVILATLLSVRSAGAEPAPRSTETPAPIDATSTGKAAPFDPFGMRGTRALAIALDIGAANSGVDSRPLGMGGTTTLDTFVVENVSVGGAFGFQYATADGSFYNVGGGPRVGYALRLGDKLALWPILSLSYLAGTVPVAASYGSASLQDLRIAAELPLVLTLGGQVAVQLGPVASTDVWRSVGGQDVAHMDLVSLRTGLLGWF